MIVVGKVTGGNEDGNAGIRIIGGGKVTVGATAVVSGTYGIFIEDGTDNDEVVIAPGATITGTKAAIKVSGTEVFIFGKVESKTENVVILDNGGLVVVGENAEIKSGAAENTPLIVGNNWRPGVGNQFRNR